MPLSITNVLGGEVHPSPFLGPIDQTGTVRVDVSALTTDEVDVNGYLKPGVILTRNGLLVGTNAVLLSGPTLSISATPEEIAVLGFDILIDGRQVTVATDATAPLSANATITALLFGVILVQVNVAGVITSKGVTAVQAYATAALALAAKPLPDAGNAEIGHIAIEADAGNWVAATDDMTNASDLVTAAFVQGLVLHENENVQRGYGAVVEAVRVAAGSTTALLDAATDIDVTVAVVCSLNRDILEDSLGRALTDDERFNISDSIVISST